MNVIGRKITSLEVAEMVGKRHDNVIRDIKLIIEQLNTDLRNEVSEGKDEINFGDNYSKGLPKNWESYNGGQLNFEESYDEGQSENGWSKIGPSYFEESYYVNSQNKKQPMFLLTKKGCELFATRMIGVKGTQFAFKYVERFEQLERELMVKQSDIPKTKAELHYNAYLLEMEKEKLLLTI